MLSQPTLGRTSNKTDFHWQMCSDFELRHTSVEAGRARRKRKKKRFFVLIGVNEIQGSFFSFNTKLFLCFASVPHFRFRTIEVDVSKSVERPLTSFSNARLRKRWRKNSCPNLATGIREKNEKRKKIIRQRANCGSFFFYPLSSCLASWRKKIKSVAWKEWEKNTNWR